MIRELEFGPLETFGRRRMRGIRFAQRSALPTTAICYVANAVRETLRRTLQTVCEIDVGEPAILDEAAWKHLAAGTYGFHTRGRQNDAVLLIGATDARTIVRRAFGEDGATRTEAGFSALELLALERLAGEIAEVFVPLFGERRGATLYRPATELPVCTAVFDVRIRTPFTATLCIALVRDVPRPLVGPALSPKILLGVEVDARAEFAAGVVPASRLMQLAIGDVLILDTKVGGAAVLKVGASRVATGDCGLAGERAAFLVRAAEMMGALA